LQAQSAQLTLAQKTELFKLLAACGFSRMEVTSFVPAKILPQFEDATEVAALSASGVELMGFAPNVKGLERLLTTPLPWVSAFVATSETFNQKNVRSSVGDTLVELEKIVSQARAAKRKVRLYISTVFGCPYEGKIALEKVLSLVEKVGKLGPDEISLGDTIGVAVPSAVKAVLAGMKPLFPVEKTALHFHNTYGLALACAQTGFEAGVRLFDGSTGGIGGCPYAKGATGNLATEELAYLFHQSGSFEFKTKPFEAALKFLGQNLKLELHSHLFDILNKGATLYGVH